MYKDKKTKEIKSFAYLTRKISDTPTAKARWVLMYIHFQIYSKAYKTNDFP